MWLHGPRRLRYLETISSAMNYSCHKCGRTLEEGRPFCPDCGAPQIRVVLPEPSPEPALAGDGAVLQEHAEAVHVLPSDSANALPPGWSHDLKPCALAAAIAITLSLVGLNPFVAALAAGWLAVTFSRRRTLGSALRPGTGARLGAITGLLIFGMSTIFETLAVVLLHKGAELRSEMLDKVQQVAQRYPGPEVQPFVDFIKTPEGFALIMVGSVIFGLIAFIALGGVGGALGAWFLGRNQRS
jgi:MFS family permease